MDDPRLPDMRVYLATVLPTTDWLRATDADVRATFRNYRMSVGAEPHGGAASTGRSASALDSQVGGNHYKKHGEFQPWNVLRAWMSPAEFRGYMKGQAIAYLAREQDKGGDEDIKKAIHYLQGLLELQPKE